MILMDDADDEIASGSQRLLSQYQYQFESFH